MREEFDSGLPNHWQRHKRGCGIVRAESGILNLQKDFASDVTYSNAQIDDYQMLKRKGFLWSPPLRLTIRARFSHDGFSHDGFSHDGFSQQYQSPAAHLTGTAGFGFWNDPFMMTALRHPTLPRALWFFYSAPPSDMPLAMGVPGSGWKAATIDAQCLPFWGLLPTAPIAIPLMRLPCAYQLLWPVAQRSICVNESLVEHTMSQWHTYAIEWHKRSVYFSVDGQSILSCNNAPRGPLGLVIWLDNQYMVMTPQGRMRYGLMASSEQESLQVDWLTIDTLSE